MTAAAREDRRRSDDTVVIGKVGNIVMIREDVENDGFDDCRVLRFTGGELDRYADHSCGTNRVVGISDSTVSWPMVVDEKWWCLVCYAMNTGDLEHNQTMA